MTEFDPTQHRMIPAQRWFEDFVVGERFVLPSRTQTPAVFAAFDMLRAPFGRRSQMVILLEADSPQPANRANTK